MTQRLLNCAFLEAQKHDDYESYYKALHIGESCPMRLPSQVKHVWKLTHLTVKDIRRQEGMTQKAMAERFCIPKRSIENWEEGSRKTPPYIIYMMCECLGYFGSLK